MGKAWDQFKVDMKANNAKTAAKHRENVNQSKTQLQQINAEAQEKRSSIESPTANVSGTRKLMAVWVAIFTAPLMIVAVVLFVMAMLLFWDAIFGL